MQKRPIILSILLTVANPYEWERERKKKNVGGYRERERDKERESGKEKESKNERESAHELTYMYFAVKCYNEFT